MNADLAIAEQAAAWLSALREEGIGDQRTAFAAWLRESPRHVEEVLFASAVERTLRGFDRDKSIDIAAILREAPGNVVPLQTLDTLPDISVPSRRVNPRARNWAAAAFVAAMAVAGWMVLAGDSAERYSTAIGEQRTIDLGEGSLLYLNTQSRAEVRFTARGRDIKLLQGEALFKVAPDSARPFRVQTADAVILALGTEFNVYQRPGGSRISVLEGRVRVEPDGQTGGHAELAAGEAVRVVADRALVKYQDPDIAQSVAWLQRRLVFKADTLEHIATEFNRYNRSPRVRIEGRAVGQMKFTGVFDAGDPHSLGLLLGTDRDLRFESRPGELVIRAR